ncbi:hypothetical protein F4778DRAFT_720324 [Xylariomycetidae sp. FL2044]|nr:hypothetical protein F4778DRAFT_720324 [Xylariomycetidae sp. FL2044]
MAAISWGTIKSLLIFFGPMLLPNAINFYRNLRNRPATSGVPIRPLPPPAQRSLSILLSAALALLLLATPVLTFLAPENVFVRTQSRLQIPTDVLFARLATLRPAGALTDADAALRAKFVNIESRLLYLQYGPEVLADCPFCASDEPRTYFWYALPGLLVPHLVNLVVLSLATTDLVASWGLREKNGSDDGEQGGSGGGGVTRWRTIGAMAAGLVAVLDVYTVNSYNHQLNARATRLGDLDMFFWTWRSYRFLALAVLDGALAALVYLASTNRIFAAPPSPAARVEAATRRLLTAKSRLNAVGILKNTALRDEDLRARTLAYWQHEGRLMREVMEEREVVEGVNDALQSRINIADIARDAELYALTALPVVEVGREQQQQQQQKQQGEPAGVVPETKVG